jgi:anti-sigma factor RsiW
MTCEQARQRLGNYLYDDLDAPERGRLEAHLSFCPDCRRELETERRFVRALARRMREISEEAHERRPQGQN